MIEWKIWNFRVSVNTFANSAFRYSIHTMHAYDAPDYPTNTLTQTSTIPRKVPCHGTQHAKQQVHLYYYTVQLKEKKEKAESIVCIISKKWKILFPKK